MSVGMDDRRAKCVCTKLKICLYDALADDHGKKESESRDNEHCLLHIKINHK